MPPHSYSEHFERGQVAANLVNVATEYECFHEMTYPVVPESN